jgi:hypothetical protein
VCPEDHPLAKRNDLSPEHLKGEDVLLLEDGHCLRDHALAACQLPSSKRSSEVGATSLHTLGADGWRRFGRNVAAEDRGRRRAQRPARMWLCASLRSLWWGVRSASLRLARRRAARGRSADACAVCCARTVFRLRTSANPALTIAWPVRQADHQPKCADQMLPRMKIGSRPKCGDHPRALCEKHDRGEEHEADEQIGDASAMPQGSAS